jgi:hypothetical protein
VTLVRASRYALTFMLLVRILIGQVVELQSRVCNALPKDYIVYVVTGPPNARASH